MAKKFILTLIASLAILVLTSCGQSGNLYLPNKDSTAQDHTL